jgi:hypothetical protein
MQSRSDQKTTSQQLRLSLACAWRAEQAGHSDAAGKSQTIELDHLLAQGNDYDNTQKGSGEPSD